MLGQVGLHAMGGRIKGFFGGGNPATGVKTPPGNQRTGGQPADVAATRPLDDVSAPDFRSRQPTSDDAPREQQPGSDDSSLERVTADDVLGAQPVQKQSAEAAIPGVATPVFAPARTTEPSVQLYDVPVVHKKAQAAVSDAKEAVSEQLTWWNRILHPRATSKLNTSLSHATKAGSLLNEVGATNKRLADAQGSLVASTSASQAAAAKASSKKGELEAAKLAVKAGPGVLRATLSSATTAASTALQTLGAKLGIEQKAGRKPQTQAEKRQANKAALKDAKKAHADAVKEVKDSLKTVGDSKKVLTAAERQASNVLAKAAKADETLAAARSKLGELQTLGAMPKPLRKVLNHTSVGVDKKFSHLKDSAAKAAEGVHTELATERGSLQKKLVETMLDGANGLVEPVIARLVKEQKMQPEEARAYVKAVITARTEEAAAVKAEAADVETRARLASSVPMPKEVVAAGMPIAVWERLSPLERQDLYRSATVSGSTRIRDFLSNEKVIAKIMGGVDPAIEREISSASSSLTRTAPTAKKLSTAEIQQKVTEQMAANKQAERERIVDAYLRPMEGERPGSDNEIITALLKTGMGEDVAKSFLAARRQDVVVSTEAAAPVSEVVEVSAVVPARGNAKFRGAGNKVIAANRLAEASKPVSAEAAVATREVKLAEEGRVEGKPSESLLTELMFEPSKKFENILENEALVEQVQTLAKLMDDSNTRNSDVIPDIIASKEPSVLLDRLIAEMRAKTPPSVPSASEVAVTLAAAPVVPDALVIKKMAAKMGLDGKAPEEVIAALQEKGMLESDARALLSGLDASRAALQALPRRAIDSATRDRQIAALEAAAGTSQTTPAALDVSGEPTAAVLPARTPPPVPARNKGSGTSRARVLPGAGSVPTALSPTVRQAPTTAAVPPKPIAADALPDAPRVDAEPEVAPAPDAIHPVVQPEAPAGTPSPAESTRIAAARAPEPARPPRPAFVDAINTGGFALKKVAPTVEKKPVASQPATVGGINFAHVREVATGKRSGPKQPKALVERFKKIKEKIEEAEFSKEEALSDKDKAPFLIKLTELERLEFLEYEKNPKTYGAQPKASLEPAGALSPKMPTSALSATAAREASTARLEAPDDASTVQSVARVGEDAVPATPVAPALPAFRLPLRPSGAQGRGAPTPTTAPAPAVRLETTADAPVRDVAAESAPRVEPVEISGRVQTAESLVPRTEDAPAPASSEMKPVADAESAAPVLQAGPRLPGAPSTGRSSGAPGAAPVPSAADRPSGAPIGAPRPPGAPGTAPKPPQLPAGGVSTGPKTGEPEAEPAGAPSGLLADIARGRKLRPVVQTPAAAPTADAPVVSASGSSAASGAPASAKKLSMQEEMAARLAGRGSSTGFVDPLAAKASSSSAPTVAPWVRGTRSAISTTRVPVAPKPKAAGEAYSQIKAREAAEKTAYEATPEGQAALAQKRAEAEEKKQAALRKIKEDANRGEDPESTVEEDTASLTLEQRRARREAAALADAAKKAAKDAAEKPAEKPAVVTQDKDVKAAARKKAEEAFASAPADVSKFTKMLAVGVPRPAVEAKMRADGLDPALLDAAVAAPTTTSSVPDVPEATAAPVRPPAPANPILAAIRARGAVETAPQVEVAPADPRAAMLAALKKRAPAGE